MSAIQKAINGHGNMFGHGAQLAGWSIAVVVAWNATSSNIDSVKERVEINRTAVSALQRAVSDIRASSVRTSDLGRLEERLDRLEGKIDERLTRIELKLDTIQYRLAPPKDSAVIQPGRGRPIP